MVDKSLEKQLAEMLMERYHSDDISEIVNSPLFIAEFEDWVQTMEKELSEENGFIKGLI